MYEKITVIGIGTLGGFLCRYLADIDSVRHLVIVDDDIVESKNVFKSIYTFSHVGDYKVDALEDLIGNDVSITKMKIKYEEKETKLPKSDLVIDCRDVVCSRYDEIDSKFYISSRTLVIDCRKNIQNICSYQGSYSIQLTRNEIKKAAFFAAQVIDSGQIKNIIKNELIQKVDLNVISHLLNNSIKKSLEDKIDIIYDYDQSRRLYSIEENIQPILQLNKSNNVKVYVGEKTINENNFLKFSETKYHLIPKNSLNNSLDVISSLTNIISKQPGVTNFILTVREENGDKYIELLEETGAA